MKTTERKWLLLSIIFIYMIPSISYGLSFQSIGSRESFAGIFSAVNIVFLISFTILLFEMIKYRTYKNISVIGDWKKSLRLNVSIIIPLLVAYTSLFFTGWFPEPSLEMHRGLGSSSFILFYIVLSIPIQQFLVCGDIFNKTKHIFSDKRLAIALASCVYMLFHLYYPQNILILVATFIIGTLWLSIYDRTGSLIGNILSHLVFGVGAMLLNLA